MLTLVRADARKREWYACNGVGLHAVSRAPLNKLLELAMKIFIDTNILLDIYHLSGPDLEELRKLTRMVQKGKVDLLVSTQVVDEFWRNRERVIANAMAAFKETKAATKIPNIIRVYSEAKELKQAADKVNEMVKMLSAKATADIEGDALKADAVVKELLDAVTVGEITEQIVLQAQRRTAVGNPPGKPDSLGDALNWEWLLEQEIAFWDDELIVISSDNDYESELIKGRPREFLVREWEAKNPGCKLLLEKSLTDFLLRRFPDIRLAEEVDKVESIERLETSSTFQSTHMAIAALNKYDDFKDSEVKRIVAAYLGNNQILWILGDSDVRAFAQKIVSAAKSQQAIEAATPLKELLADLDKQEQEAESDDDDIPF